MSTRGNRNLHNSNTELIGLDKKATSGELFPYPEPMLITEDLLLLLLPDTTRARVRVACVPAALAAAVLIDLADHGRLDVDEDGWLVLTNTELTGHALLDDALRRLAEEQDGMVEDMMAAIVTGIVDRTLDALTERGILAKITKNRWRRTTTTWWLEERTYRDQLRTRLREILLDGTEPDDRTSTLIYLLSTIRVIPDAIEHPPSDELIERAEEIADGDWPRNPVTIELMDAGDDWLLVGDGNREVPVLGPIVKIIDLLP